MRSLVLNANACNAVRSERTHALIKSGYEVAEAASGAEVLSMAMRMLPDLIVMKVPIGSDDSDLWRRLRSRSQTRHVPLLLTCALGSSYQQNMYLADAWLPDPVNPDLLISIIQTLLRQGASEGHGCESALIRLRPGKVRQTRMPFQRGQALSDVYRPGGSAEKTLGVKRRPSDIAHDLLSPLSTITAIAGWMVDEYGKALDENGREYLVLLQKSIERMHSTVQALFGDREASS